MARTRRSLDERIEEQEQVVSKAKEHYESEVNKLEQLMNKRDEFQKKGTHEGYRRHQQKLRGDHAVPSV